MLRIGDFSKLSRISIRMLRHYDEIGILHPKSVDAFTGYRYYSESQLPLAERIQALKNLGFGLSMVKEILDKYSDPQEMERFLLVKRKELEPQKVQQAAPLLYLSCEPRADGQPGRSGYGGLFSGKEEVMIKC